MNPNQEKVRTRARPLLSSVRDNAFVLAASFFLIGLYATTDHKNRTGEWFSTPNFSSRQLPERAPVELLPTEEAAPATAYDLPRNPVVFSDPDGAPFHEEVNLDEPASAEDTARPSFTVHRVGGRVSGTIEAGRNFDLSFGNSRD